LIVRGEVIGTIGLDALKEMREFEPAEIALAQTITNQAATAVANARLYKTIEERARQLEAANEELKALDHMKDDFVQTVSHELRTPLTFIKGYIDLLLEGTLGDLNQEQLDALTIVAERTQNVTSLVNDIISLIRAGTTGLAVQPVDLATVALSSVQSARAVTKQANIHLETDFAEDLPLVLGDPQRLSQVFDNLIGNAIKFGPNGGTIRVSVQPEDRFVRAEITDQGIGVPADKLDRIWERFYQVESATTRRFSGTGLGLTIVKRLVEAHGGRVGVHSVEGQGSTFFFTIPVLAEDYRGGIL
jgi:signal transduction histidine kinase